MQVIQHLNITNIFGNGVLGNLATASIRLPTLMASAISALMVAELAIRVMKTTLEALGFDTEKDLFINRLMNWISNSGIRPYKEETVTNLFKKLFCFTLLSILGAEFARIAGGSPPNIYNKTLTFFGPLRVDQGSYLENIKTLVNWK